MKLILFTISNEQIKEQLSKLQTKVESLETVKDVQDKIISAKDSQITFLQGEISSISNWVIFVGGAIIALASAAFLYIRYLEKKATKKIEEAENTLQLVTTKLAEVENSRQQTESNLTESDSRIEQLDVLIGKSNNIATIAQEKIDKLEEKHKELYNLATATTENQKIDMSIREINMHLDLSKSIIDQIFAYHENVIKISKKQEGKLLYLNRQYTSLLTTYRRLFSTFTADIVEGRKIEDTITNGTNTLKMNSINLYKECIELINELDLLY
ncbi:TPA: hypothetical protein QCX91_003243 [Bacillus thuringiensis]|uniref:hypothetical protein n=1 Tax=Bacillus sp. CH_70 TaxID=2978215 RepID=UPI0030F5C72E|nr:hypothetical protein [Bacillus thuringiensis]